VLVARARTFAKMGIVKESLDDVNTVLKEDPDNHQVCCCCCCNPLASPVQLHRFAEKTSIAYPFDSDKLVLIWAYVVFKIEKNVNFFTTLQ